MGGERPESLGLTFPDGRTLTVPFAEIPVSLQDEVLRQPFAASPSPDPSAERYVMMTLFALGHEKSIVSPVAMVARVGSPLAAKS